MAGGVHGNNRLGGNSLTDIFVFGRRAGIHAGKIYNDIEMTPVTLDHVESYQRDLKQNGIQSKRTAPVLLPDYRHEKAVNHYDQ